MSTRVDELKGLLEELMRISLAAVAMALCVADVGFANASPLESTPQQFFAYAIDPVAPGACTPTAINDSGVVIGVNITNPPYGDIKLAFTTGPNGVGVKALTFGGQWSYATGVNASGQVVGNAVFSDEPFAYGAFITDPGGDNIHPYVQNDARLSVGLTGINDAGQLIGTYWTPGFIQPFITDPGGVGMRLLGVLQNGSYARPTAINNKGQVVGFSSKRGVAGQRAFVTGPNGKGMRDLRLPEKINIATDINDSGQITGTTQQYDDYVPGDKRQFITDKNGANPRSLGGIQGDAGALNGGSDINNAGIAVGRGTRDFKNVHILATITDPHDRMRNLNRYVVNLPDKVWLTGDTHINNRNQIAAAASDGRCYIVCPTQHCKP